MELAHIEEKFIDIGGQFYSSGFDLREKLPGIKALIFAWDGVFNDGQKKQGQDSSFSEIDALGLDMLRFGFQLAFEQIPKMVFITPGKNENCHEFAKRANFDEVYYDSHDQAMALQHFCDLYHIKPSEVALFYGDITEVPLAKKAGMAFAVGRLSNPIFIEYLERNKLADYISSCHGHEHVIREFSELLLGLLDIHFTVIDERAYFGERYIKYCNYKKTVQTSIRRCQSALILNS